jgi:hypothetical protein
MSVRVGGIRLETLPAAGSSKILNVVVKSVSRIGAVKLWLSIAPPSSHRWVFLRERRFETLVKEGQAKSRIRVVTDVNCRSPEVRIAFCDAVLINGRIMSTARITGTIPISVMRWRISCLSIQRYLSSSASITSRFV